MSLDKQEAIATLKDLTAGTVGACAGIIAGQPLDTIKTRYQVSRNRYKNVFDCFRQTVQYEGVGALYKGMLSPLLGNAPLNMIVFGTNGNMNRILNKYYPDTNTTQPNYMKLYISGTYAGAAQCIVCTPVELVKCRMQVQQNTATAHTLSPLHVSTNTAIHGVQPNLTLSAEPVQPQYKGSIDCARQIYRQFGIRGLYRGWWTEFWRDAPSYGLWFVAYEYVKHTLTPINTVPTTSTLLLAGSAAGVATWIVTYPFDVLKSVVQAAPDITPQHQLKISYISRVMYKQYGIKWFYTGIGTTLIRAVPVSAVTFLVYERLMSYFNSTSVNDHEDCSHELQVTK